MTSVRLTDAEYVRPVNSRAWAIGTTRPTGVFDVRRIVWGRLMAREEKRDGETIRGAIILVQRPDRSTLRSNGNQEKGG